MSDLTATNCGIGCGGDSGSLILIVLLLCCGGMGGLGSGRCGDSGCDSAVWLILILCLCGSGGFGC